MRITPDKTAALFIDYQEKLVPALFESDTFVKNSLILAKGLSALNIPIVVSEQYPKGLGTTVSALKEVESFSHALPKMTFSCIKTDELLDALRATGAKNIIVSGCEAHICVLQSVIDLLEKEFSVYLVADCITSRREYDKKYGIMRAEEEGAFITTYESILFELLVKAGGDVFKEISKLIK